MNQSIFIKFKVTACLRRYSLLLCLGRPRARLPWRPFHYERSLRSTSLLESEADSILTETDCRFLFRLLTWTGPAGQSGQILYDQRDFGCYLFCGFGDLHKLRYLIWNCTRGVVWKTAFCRCRFRTLCLKTIGLCNGWRLRIRATWAIRVNQYWPSLD